MCIILAWEYFPNNCLFPFSENEAVTGSCGRGFWIKVTNDDTRSWLEWISHLPQSHFSAHGASEHKTTLHLKKKQKKNPKNHINEKSKILILVSNLLCVSESFAMWRGQLCYRSCCNLFTSLCSVWSLIHYSETRRSPGTLANDIGSIISLTIHWRTTCFGA